MRMRKMGITIIENVMIPRIIIDDLIGKSFILSSPPLEFHIKNKGVHVDREHPLLQILLLQMRLPHIHIYDVLNFAGRAKLRYSGT